MSSAPIISSDDGSPPRTARGPGRKILRIVMWVFTVVAVCCAMGVWTMREYSDQMSPARAVARRVRWGLPFDRQETIDTLLQASGEEIDVALPAVIKLEATAGPEEQARLLSGMTNLLISRLTSRTLGSPPLAFEVASPLAQSVLDTLCAALLSPDDATRAAAARSLRVTLLRDTTLWKLFPINDRAHRLVDADAVFRSLEDALADPLADVRKDAIQALGNLGPALDREPPPALRKALRDPSPGVRNEAAVAVALFGKGLDPCLPDLFQIMKENCKESRLSYAESEGAMTVGEIRRVLDPCLLDVFRLAPIEWFAQVRRVAFTGPRTSCLEAVAQGSKDRKATVKSMPILTEALGSPYGQIRGVAAVLLGRIGPEAAPALPGLVAALKRSLPYKQSLPDPHAYLERQEIVTALRKIDPEGNVIRREVLPFLVSASALGDPRTRDDAAMALGSLGSIAEPAMPTLLDIIRNPKQPDHFRQSAAWTLVQITKGTSSIG
ncbi:MAG: HEAT repeat domain-containing protein, partial [Isosphaeraceae bacterium]